jgi:hypothetical protein
MSGWTDEQIMNAIDRDLTGELINSILTVYKIPDAPLTVQDRCDGCPAAAQVRVHRPPSEEHPHRRGQLQFCGHHYTRHGANLKAEGWVVATRTETNT